MSSVFKRQMGMVNALGSWRLDPHLGCNFYVQIGALIAGQFREVRGLEGSIQVEEIHEGGRNTYSHKLPGQVSYGNLTLSHGITDLQTMWGWFEATALGFAQRMDITVMMLDQSRLPILWWDIAGALPVKWTGPTLDARSGEVAVESVELIHRGITKSLFSEVVTAARLAYSISQMFSK